MIREFIPEKKAEGQFRREARARAVEGLVRRGEAALGVARPLTAEEVADMLAVRRRTFQRYASGEERMHAPLIKLFCVLTGLVFEEERERFDRTG